MEITELAQGQAVKRPNTVIIQLYFRPLWLVENDLGNSLVSMPYGTNTGRRAACDVSLVKLGQNVCM